MILIFEASKLCTDICKTILAFFKPQFHHEYDFVQHRYFELFSRHGQYFHPTKDQPRTRPSSTFLYICYNFRQIFCTNVIQFFSVENMGHNQLQKCTKYHLVSLLNEKQGPTFANFLQLFIHVTLLTHSAMNHFFFAQVSTQETDMIAQSQVGQFH